MSWIQIKDRDRSEKHKYKTSPSQKQVRVRVKKTIRRVLVRGLETKTSPVRGTNEHVELRASPNRDKSEQKPP